MSVALLALLGCTAACASGGSGGNPRLPTTVAPPKIIPASAGVVSGTSPTSDGRVWVLGGTAHVKTLTEIGLRGGKVLKITPVERSATSVAASVNGEVGVGLATRSTGALELRNDGIANVAVPLNDPVTAVAAGDDGTTFYVLSGRRSGPPNDNVAIVDSSNGHVQQTIPAPAHAVAVQPTPDQASVYVLDKSGVVSEISVADGGIDAQFSVGMPGIGLAMAPSGSTLFVLGGTGSTCAIARISLATDSQTGVVPAPANSVAIAAGVDDQQLFDFVGTPTVGNVQIIQLSSA